MAEKSVVKVVAGSKVVEVIGLGKTVENGGEPLTILQDISFSVMAGESIAIVGASGSGKSTLLGLLAGLDLPSVGEVRLRGLSLAALDEDARAVLRSKQLGFVFQSFQLLPSLTALENVLLPLELAGCKGATEKACNWLEKVGLSHRLRHYPKHLSGGEQQRVALARAFVDASLCSAIVPLLRLKRSPIVAVTSAFAVQDARPAADFRLLRAARPVTWPSTTLSRLRPGRFPGYDVAPVPVREKERPAPDQNVLRILYGCR